MIYAYVAENVDILGNYDKFIIFYLLANFCQHILLIAMLSVHNFYWNHQFEHSIKNHLPQCVNVITGHSNETLYFTSIISTYY